MPKLVTMPEGDFVESRYDVTTGNLWWKQTGRAGDDTVRFAYYGSGTGAKEHLLQSVTQPPDVQGVRPVEVLDYDAYGNLWKTTSPLGARTINNRDVVGRVVEVRTDIDADTTAGAAVKIDSTYFDVMDRDSVSRSIGVARHWVLQQVGTVAKTYDAHGNLISLTRSASAPSAVDAMTTQVTYNRLSRLVRETSPDNKVEVWAHNEAGSITQRVNRRGQTTYHFVDLLGRDTLRVANEITYGETASNFQFSPSFPLYGNGIRIPADTARFGYDHRGNILTANNRDARVTRQYFGGGAVKKEIANIRKYDTTSTDFSAHQYEQNYTYDLNGRRVRLNDGTPLQVTYDHDPTTGDLIGVNGFGALVVFEHDAAGRLISSNGGGVSEILRYDASGRLARRIQSSPGWPGIIHDDSLQYDARDRILFAQTVLDTVTLSYSALGHVTDMTTREAMTGVRRFETAFNDALGYLVRKNGAGADFPPRDLTYHRSTGRLARTHESSWVADTLVYDAAGNDSATWGSQAGAGGGLWFESRSYYGADGKLRVFDKRVRSSFGVTLTPAQHGTFEEYRYDALGRRILRRARRAVCEGPCQSVIERFVWDGDQLVTEIRYPGSATASAFTLERDTGYVTYEQPRGPVTEIPPPVIDTMIRPWYGRVDYVHGGGIDRPLVVVRSFYGDSTLLFGVYGLRVYPYYNWRGLPDVGSTNGTPGSAGEKIYWVGRDVRMYGDRSSGGVPRSWFGSLIEDQQDASGLRYRRNRYYDPKNGRFTQEDPIGLAGGLNLYGFANGDPVNFSDPFGPLAEATDGDCNKKTGEGCSAEYKRLLREDKPLEDAGLADPLLLVGGLEAKGAGAAAGAARRAIAGRITGFTKHGINQAISREGVGVSSRAILDAVKNPVKTVAQSGGRTMYVGRDANVVLNSAGEVITVIPRGSRGFRIQP
ncbi:MAG: RHS repeat-associated core domain-containing protein [Gemmatimonadaceae bacterium]